MKKMVVMGVTAIMLTALLCSCGSKGRMGNTEMKEYIPEDATAFWERQMEV